jgi:hypothetical protein
MKYLKVYNLQTCNLLIFLCGPVENMLGPVKCGSKLALDQKKSGNFQRCRNSLHLQSKNKNNYRRVGVYKHIA